MHVPPGSGGDLVHPERPAAAPPYTPPMSTHHRRFAAFALAVVTSFGLSGTARGQAPRVPTIEDLLAVKQTFGTQVSPDGNWVAYSVTETDLQQDAFVTHLWLARPSTRRDVPVDARPQVCGAGAVVAGRPLARPSRAPRVGDKSQVFVIRPDGGESVQATKAEGGVNEFAWSADGRQIAFTAPEPDSQARKDRKEHLGEFEVVRRRLHVRADLDARRGGGAARSGGRQAAYEGHGVPAGPAGMVAGRHPHRVQRRRRTPDLVQRRHRRHLRADACRRQREGDRHRSRGPTRGPTWSPDGASIAFGTAMGRPDYFHRNSRIAVVPAAGGTPTSLTDPFDENANLVAWAADGQIYFTASAEDGRPPVPGRSAQRAHRAGQQAGRPEARRGSRCRRTPGRWRSSPRPRRRWARCSSRRPSRSRRKPLTRMTDQLKEWRIGTREVISWTSRDGTEIEGRADQAHRLRPVEEVPAAAADSRRARPASTGQRRPTCATTRATSGSAAAPSC